MTRAATGAVTAIHGDARVDNWRFVVPPGRSAVLRRLEELPGPDVDGVVAPDLQGLGDRPVDVLRRVCATVPVGGWLYVGLGTAPLGSRRRPAPRTVFRVLAGSGFVVEQAFLPFPSHRSPAYLVPAGRRTEFDFFLSELFFPFTAARTALRGRSEQVLLAVGRLVARWAPHPVRLALTPSLAVVARRTGRRPS